MWSFMAQQDSKITDIARNPVRAANTRRIRESESAALYSA